LDTYSCCPTAECSRRHRRAVCEFHAVSGARANNRHTGGNARCRAFLPGESTCTVHEHPVVKDISDATPYRTEIFELVIAGLAIGRMAEQWPTCSRAAEGGQSVKGGPVEVAFDTQEHAAWQLIVESKLTSAQDSACGPAVGKGERINRSLSAKDASSVEINVA